MVSFRTSMIPAFGRCDQSDTCGEDLPAVQSDHVGPHAVNVVRVAVPSCVEDIKRKAVAESDGSVGAQAFFGGKEVRFLG